MNEQANKEEFLNQLDRIIIRLAGNIATIDYPSCNVEHLSADDWVTLGNLLVDAWELSPVCWIKTLIRQTHEIFLDIRHTKHEDNAQDLIAILNTIKMIRLKVGNGEEDKYFNE